MSHSDEEIRKLREEVRLLTAWLDISDQRLILMQRQLDNMAEVITSIGRAVFHTHFEGPTK